MKQECNATTDAVGSGAKAVKFSAKEDIGAPIDTVFAEISDFQSFERMALRRGAEISRLDGLREAGRGMMWDVVFELRGKRRQLRLELVRYVPADGVTVAFRSDLTEGSLVADLVSLSKQRTRLCVDLEILPRTLTARLLMKPLRLLQGNMARRFQLRVAHFARDMEERSERRG